MRGKGGFGVSAPASKSKGNADGTGATQVNSHVNGSESVSIASGNDTNVQGSVVSGGKVIADVGGNLNPASREDMSETHAKQESMGGGFSISQGGGSASFSASRGRADGTYLGYLPSFRACPTLCRDMPAQLWAAWCKEVDLSCPDRS
ncbi:hemagglutinin repeat-containing protein [Ralstonia pseudosolanacearum]